MSYFALATDSFDAVVQFYRDVLCFPVVEDWDRVNGRGRRFDIGGVRLEIRRSSIICASARPCGSAGLLIVSISLSRWKTLKPLGADSQFQRLLHKPLPGVRSFSNFGIRTE